LLIGVLLNRILSSQNEALVNRPTANEKREFANIILNNSSIFYNGTLDKARDVMEWMDAILYEDLRKLAHSNKLNIDNVLKVLS
jgi:hypothetical protein